MPNPPFSEKFGHIEPRLILQVDEIDAPLRNRLLNCVRVGPPGIGNREQLSAFGKTLCDGFFKQPVIGARESWLEGIIHDFFRGERWYRLYDLLEFVAHALDGPKGFDFVAQCNKVLEEEQSAYRFLQGKIVPVNSEFELAAIEAGLRHPIKEARGHISNSLKLLGTRPTPNYAKVAAEAIQAVEAVARHLVGSDSASLGDALKKLRRHETHHAALLEAFLKLHGWASDEGGVRHAFKGNETDQPLAKYVLVSCSAFIGYLTEVASAKA